ncbi:MAG: YceI family protein [Salibacteraceae bacterium]
MIETRIHVIKIAPILMLILPMITQGQSLQMNPNSTLSIYGTSNVHDWSEHCESPSGIVEINEVNGEITAISSLHFNTKAESIKSGKSTMDEYTYEALKSKSHPNIEFEATDISVNKTTAGYKVLANGTMSIAGQSREEQISTNCTYHNKSLKCEGKKSIDMTLYGIEPPSIMFGAMTVGKDVEVHFETSFN